LFDDFLAAACTGVLQSNQQICKITASFRSFCDGTLDELMLILPPNTEIDNRLAHISFSCTTTTYCVSRCVFGSEKNLEWDLGMASASTSKEGIVGFLSNGFQFENLIRDNLQYIPYCLSVVEKDEDNAAVCWLHDQELNISICSNVSCAMGKRKR
jgi:hypothetical protein